MGLPTEYKSIESPLLIKEFLRMKTPTLSGLLSLVCLNTPLFAAMVSKDISNVPVRTQQGFVRLDNQTVKMPNNEKSMGLIGSYYLLDINPYLSAGGGFLSAVYGQQGGLFTLGAILNSKIPLTDKIYADAGVYLGGGGGQRSLVGGGMVINSHAGIGYQVSKNLSLSLNYANLNFVDGDISSSQLMFVADIPFDYRYAPFNLSGVTTPFKNLDFINSDKTPSQSYFSVIGHLGFPVNDSKTTDNQSLDNTLTYMGMEIGRYFDENFLIYMQVEAMVHGLRGGYMQVLGGIGYEKPINEDLSFIPRLSLGAAGGGGTDTGGGFLIYPEAMIEYKLSDKFALDMSLGYQVAPDGKYNVVMAGGALKYVSTAFYHNHPNQPEYLQGWRVNSAHQSYLEAQRLNNREHVGLLQLQIDYMASDDLYFAGQTDFAYIGNAGAYGEGLVGLGAQKTLSEGLTGFVQVLAGASGGGGIDSQEGLVIKPAIGVFKSLNKRLSARASVSELYSVHSNWHTLGLSLGLSYKFSTISEA